MSDAKPNYAKRKLVASGQQFQTERGLFLAFVNAVCAKVADVPTLQMGTPKDCEVEFTYVGKHYILRHKYERIGDRFESRLELTSREDTMGDNTPLTRAITLTKGGGVKYPDGKDSGLFLNEENAEDIFLFLLTGMKPE